MIRHLSTSFVSICCRPTYVLFLNTTCLGSTASLMNRSSHSSWRWTVTACFKLAKPRHASIPWSPIRRSEDTSSINLDLPQITLIYLYLPEFILSLTLSTSIYLNLIKFTLLGHPQPQIFLKKSRFYSSQVPQLP